MTLGVAALTAGVAYGAAGLAGMLLEADHPKTLAQHAVRLAATLGCAAAGAFAATRGFGLERLVVSAIVLAALSSTIASEARVRTSLPYSGLVALAAVVLSALFDGSWPVVGAAALAAVPFGLAALVNPRPSSGADAVLCAVSGATLGVLPATVVLFLASFWTLGRAGACTPPAVRVRFAPAIATFTMLGVLVDLALVT